MRTQRTLLVGGLSSVHDPLLSAALRGCGLAAETLHARTDAGLKLARGLGNHGQCNPAHYAVGAVLEHARASHVDSKEFCETNAWLTVGSCGPCRLAAFRHEYARVLGGADLGELPVLFVDQLAFASEDTSGSSPIDSRAAGALLTAVVAGDVLAQSAHRVRPYVADASEVDLAVTETIDDIVHSLERGSALEPALANLRSRFSRMAQDHTRVLPRVLLVGEPWTTLADGAPSYDLARRLTLFGAEIMSPTVTDWLVYRLWEERAAGTGRLTLAAAGETLRATWVRLAGAAGLSGYPADIDALVELAGPHYDPRIRGGSAHLEVGRALAAARNHSAHLVLSLKPFGCLPSSSLSDGVLSVLLRAEGGPRFLALETTGDGDATAESRVEMALLAATLTAADEFDAACAGAGLSPPDALSLLEVPDDLEPPEPRVYACTAAERVRRFASRVSHRPALETAQ